MARGKPKKNQEVNSEMQLGVASVNFKPHPDEATSTIAYDFSIHLIPKEKWEANGITKESTIEFINKSFDNCKAELIKTVFPE